MFDVFGLLGPKWRRFRRQIKLDDMAAGAVLAHEMRLRLVRMDAGHGRKAGIARFTGRAEEQGQVHHAVDDGVAQLLAAVPGLDEPGAGRGGRVEAAHQQRCGMEGIPFGLLIAVDLVLRAAGEQVHEAHIVVEVTVDAEFLGHQLRGAEGLAVEGFFGRKGVHEPHHTGPEARRPPGIAQVPGRFDPLAVTAGVGDVVVLRGLRHGAAKLRGDFGDHFINVVAHGISPYASNRNSWV